MIVLLSDLHITDGSTANNIHPSVFEILAEEIRSTVERKKDIKEIHIVLLGDIFDFVRTNYWLRNNIPMSERPWGGTLNPDTGMNTRTDIIEAQFREIFRCMLSATDTTATSLLKMVNVLSSEVEPIQITVTYVVGNHDRVLNNFPNLKEDVAKQFNKSVNFRFANHVKAPEYGLLARHGHEWDDDCYPKDFWEKVLHPEVPITRFDPRLDNVMSIGEVITAEIMSGLIHYCKEEFAVAGLVSPADIAVLTSLKDANNVRPWSASLLWLQWITKDKEQYKKPILKAVLKAVGVMLESSLAKQWDRVKLFDLVTLLSLGEIFMRGGQLPVANCLLELYAWKQKLFPPRDACKDGARTETLLHGISEAMSYIVYGHTHVERQDFFERSLGRRHHLVPQSVHDDAITYINTGTYLPFIQMCEGRRSFAQAHRMTMAFLYKSDEDTAMRIDECPTLQLWNGVMRKNYK